MRFEMGRFATDRVLAGALQGQKVFVAIVESTRAQAEPEICYLDFSGVEVATTSFLRESVVAYRNYARSQSSLIYPVVANLAPSVREELENFLRDRGDAIISCATNGSSETTNVEILGRLEGKQLVTLQAVIARGEVDAPTLAKEFTNEGPTSPTAWNNLLVALVAKGLVMEVSFGRTKRYRPVLEGLHYGA